MIKINVSEDKVLNLLMDRFHEFTGLEPDTEEYKLFEKMYQKYLDDKTFENMEEFDVNKIVDNDWVNNCNVIGEGEEDYNQVKELYEKNGCCDISCETCYSLVEAANDDETLFLVRY